MITIMPQSDSHGEAEFADAAGKRPETRNRGFWSTVAGALLLVRLAVITRLAQVSGAARITDQLFQD